MHGWHVRVDGVHQSDPLGPDRIDIAPGKGELCDVAGADDPREALEAPEIGHDGHLCLADREEGVSRCETDVTCGDEVDAASDAVAMHRSDHRLGTLSHRSDGRLEPEDLDTGSTRTRCRRRSLSIIVSLVYIAGQDCGHRLQIEADGEVRASGRYHDRPDGLFLGHPVHGYRQIAPQ